MSGFRLTRKAREDLRDIGRYTQETWGREQRNRYLALLDQAFHDLAASPRKGRDCGGLRAGYRKHGVGKHVIFYRSVVTGGIEIVRILHERMDVEARLADP